MKLKMKNKLIIAMLLLSSIGMKITFAQSEIKTTLDSLPTAVKAELKNKYSDYAVNSITMTTDKTKSVTYKMELQKKNNIVQLEYDVAGKLISKSKRKIYSFDGTEKPPKSKPSENNDGHNHQH